MYNVELSSRLGLGSRRNAFPGAQLSNEAEMDAIPLEVSSAFVAIAAGGALILAGYIFNKWRK